MTEILGWHCKCNTKDLLKLVAGSEEPMICPVDGCEDFTKEPEYG